MKNKKLSLFLVYFLIFSSIISINPVQTTPDVARRIHTLSKIDLTQVIPRRTTEGFLPFLEWINAYENLPDYATEKLLIAFTRKGRVIHSVEFKIPRKESLAIPSQIEEVADYVARLVLFGMAFIGGDGVVANWSEQLREHVENIFQHSIEVDEKGNPLYKEWKGMIHYLEMVYGKKYEFNRANREEIEKKPKMNMGFLMEVDKAVINMNPEAAGFAVPNAGPYGLPGVIEQYTPNQRGIYNLFKGLVENDQSFKEELERLGLMPQLEPPEKQIMRNILLLTQDLIKSNEEIDKEIRDLNVELGQLEQQKERGEIDIEDYQKRSSEILDKINILTKVKLISVESKEKVKNIYYEMGKAVGVTILIAKHFMDIRHVMITGQATEGLSGEIIKEAADKVTGGSVRIWLPSEDPLEEVGAESQLMKFDVEKEKLSSFGQAIAMAGKISEKIYGEGNITQGKVIGIDAGSSDVKVVYSDNGKILFAKKYRWDSGKITDTSEITHQEIIQGLIDLARLKVTLMQPEYQDEKYNELREKVLVLEKSDGSEYKAKDEKENVEPQRLGAIDEVLKKAEELKIKLIDFDGFALSWAGAVLENRIVGRASIVKGLSDEGFKDKITDLGKKIAEVYGNIPYLVINDGEAAAIMARMMGLPNAMALAFGTSTGGGY